MLNGNHGSTDNMGIKGLHHYLYIKDLYSCIYRAYRDRNSNIYVIHHRMHQRVKSYFTIIINKDIWSRTIVLSLEAIQYSNYLALLGYSNPLSTNSHLCTSIQHLNICNQHLPIYTPSHLYSKLPKFL